MNTTRLSPTIDQVPSRWQWLLSIETLWVGLVVVAAFALGCRNPIRPNDFWWHMKVGEIILGTGQIPATDLFSFTAYGQPWLYQSWLAEVVFQMLYAVGGLELIAVAQGVLVAAATALVCWHGWLASHHARLAALTTALMVGIAVAHWNVRPQSFSYPLFALFGLTLWVWRNRQMGTRPARTRWIWALPVLMALWVNLHGAFTLGLVLIGLTLAGEVLKRLLRPASALPWRRLGELAAVAGLSLLACFANPRGLGIVQYLSEFQTHEITQTLGREWQPTSPREFAGMAFFAATLLCLGVLVYSARRIDLTDLLLLLAFGWLGLSAIRGTVWFGLLMAPILAGYLAAIPARSDTWDLTWLTARFRRAAGPRRPAPLAAALNLALLGVLALGAVVALPWFDLGAIVPADLRGNLALISPDTPVDAGEYLAAQAPGARMFHTEAYGSYFVWRLYGYAPVFVDTRLELYPPAVWYDYLALSYGRHDWEALLSRYAIDTLVLDKGGLAGLTAVVSTSSNWAHVYEDDVTIIYCRTGGAP
ncbi:MAG: hypothetical protein KKA73_19950 [Chloroflexi bacterium]|nr:hypothetical protein [Chloroflexota bacterium]MBU1749963.1 hypothetical protein [Chloroflexota bacterium]